MTTIDQARVEQPVSSRGAKRGWAAAGVLAGGSAVASIQLSTMASPVYDAATPPTAAWVAEQLSTKVPVLIGFHLTTTIAALLLMIFAAGLKRRLDAQAPADSLLPNVAAIGLVITSAILIMGAGLNTEFIFGLATPGMMPATDVSFYSHWVATISWLWVAAGVSAVALGLASLRGAAPRWIGVVSLVLGALTALLGVSPLQYMAGFVGPLWLLVVALGFLLGDRR
ncbi:hypothetical protein MLP_43220 [Microlunatus phosphovorus NM-1]|uniref:DUF4386 domain-containing protein n=1 Tax=Microlunatus phosphovorus (strain ATCC 700054 / DSM 10555 / JCM 9379 / NBRC 101784 / NCIMB 13414 / VKM Ac-1990 / NM-1) TaxID=1032480 RepID=F5XSS8_MICPN|nr:hypothetical protein [Microlunatus phosphovorus]BAK37336.1 hypothetical protein MLP_43220 [Microlunatus phosphovorus NM-1]